MRTSVIMSTMKIKVKKMQPFWCCLLQFSSLLSAGPLLLFYHNGALHPFPLSWVHQCIPGSHSSTAMISNSLLAWSNLDLLTSSVSHLYLADDFLKNLYCYSITVVCLFSPSLHPTLAEPTSTLPLDFVHVSFIVVPVIPSSHCPLPTPPWLLLDCS